MIAFINGTASRKVNSLHGHILVNTAVMTLCILTARGIDGYEMYYVVISLIYAGKHEKCRLTTVSQIASIVGLTLGHCWRNH